MLDSLLRSVCALSEVVGAGCTTEIPPGLRHSSPFCQHHRLACSYPRPKGDAFPEVMPLCRGGPHLMAGGYSVERPSPRPQFGTTLNGIPSPQLPTGSAGTYITTASHFNVTFCLILLASLPYKSCFREPSPVTLLIKMSI